MSVLAPPSRMLLGVRVALAVACLADALAVHVPAAPVKLLPLGDSITFGCGDYCGGADAPTTVGCNGTYGVGDKCCAKPFGKPTPHPWTPCMGCSGGYRAPLESRLAASKRTRWEFVGSVQQDGGSWHEGHPGWRIDQIAGTCIDANHTLPDGHVESGNCQGGNASFFKRWVALKPDVIILMIGTNDIGQLYNTTCSRSQTPWVCSVEPIARRLVGLVNATFSALPHVKLLLSDLIGIGPQPCYGPDGPVSGQGLGEQMVLDYNAMMPTIASHFAAAGFAIQHVPLLTKTGIGTAGKGLCPCHYHPTHDTYVQMADIYHDSLSTMFDTLQ